MKEEDFKKLFPNVQEDISLSSFSTFGIGGKAKWFYEVKEEKELVQLIKFCGENDILFHLGGGSNIYF